MVMNSKFVRNSVNVLLVFLGILLLTVFFSVRSWYKPSIKLNEVSPITIILDKDTKVVDVAATNESKEEAKRESIQRVSNRQILEIDNDAAKASTENLNFLVKIAKTETGVIKEENKVLNEKIKAETQTSLLKLDEADFNEFRVVATQAAQDIDNEKFKEYLEEFHLLIDIERETYLKDLDQLRIDEAKVAEAKEELGKGFFDELSKVDSEALFAKAKTVQKKLLDLGIVNGLPSNKVGKNITILYPELTNVEQTLIRKLIEKSTLPNIKIDWRRVHEVEQEAMDKVPDIIAELPSGTVLAKKGKQITEENFYFLKELKMLHPKPHWMDIFENFLLICICVILLIVALFFIKPRKFTTQEVILMLLVVVGCAATSSLISVWGINKMPIVPLATISILLTVFYMPIMAGILTALIAFLMLNSFGLNIWQILPLIVGSIVAIFLTLKSHQRENLTNAGTWIAISQVTTFALTLVLAVGQFELLPVLILAALYAISGLASGVIALAVLPYLEAWLRLMTPFKLAELSNPDQPLLRMLKEKAPGTYQHSLSVLELAEEACRSIDGKTELIRVGILYHDIGKTYKPDYFIENQFGKPNPHTTLDDPKQSANIILAHVPEGIKLAKKYNLPQAVIDFIPMHQGSTVTNYFYHKAIEKYGTSNVNQDDFRYPGPPPNTKETGICMLADSVEAAIKSMKDLTSESEVMNMINRIISARLNEGELDNSGLDRAELDKVGEAFLRVWRTKNHERVKYPGQEKAN